MEQYAVKSLTETHLLYFSVILGAFVKLRKGTFSFFVSVGPLAWNTSASNGQIFMKFAILVFFKNLMKTFRFLSNLTKITGTLLEDQYTFMIISHSVLNTRNGSEKSRRESQNTCVMFHDLFSKIVPFMRYVNNFVEQGGLYMTVWCIHILRQLSSRTGKLGYKFISSSNKMLPASFYVK